MMEVEQKLKGAGNGVGDVLQLIDEVEALRDRCRLEEKAIV